MTATATPHYIVAICRDAYLVPIAEAGLEPNWHVVTNRAELTARLAELEPRYIFFLHWSWMVPAELLERCECVCFHMTDVPYGRGGSPLQNLIVRGHRSTQLTALRMTAQLDAGPVYGKVPLSLEGSTAEEIYLRACQLSLQVARQIAAETPEPTAQKGDPTLFSRRTPAESEIPDLANLDKLHDFIRMLDAEGYPPAFLRYKGYRFQFSRSARYADSIKADVTITPEQDGATCDP